MFESSKGFEKKFLRVKDLLILKVFLTLKKYLRDL
jgi:hypothetical protein